MSVFPKNILAMVWRCWLSFHLLQASLWTTLVRVEESWPDEASWTMSSAKYRDTILRAPYQTYSKEISSIKVMNAAMVESSPHLKWIWLPASNAVWSDQLYREPTAWMQELVKSKSHQNFFVYIASVNFKIVPRHFTQTLTPNKQQWQGETPHL